MKNLLERFKKIRGLFAKKSVSYEQSGINPGRDWTVILFVANLIVILSAIYSYYLFYKIDNDQLVSVDSVGKEAETKINTDLLLKVENELNDRSSNLNKIKSAPVPADPSL